MRVSVRRTLSVLGIITAVSVGVVAPAYAAGGTDTTFTITGGVLSISVPASAALGTGNSGDLLLTGTLGNVTVTDARGANLGTYTTTVSGTAFANGTFTIPATAALYTAPVITGTGIAVRLPGAPGDLSTARTAATATGVIGNNTSVWNPAIAVTLPPEAVAGLYSGIVTHSVA